MYNHFNCHRRFDGELKRDFVLEKKNLEDYTNKINTDIAYKRLAISCCYHIRLSVNTNICNYFNQDVLNIILIFFEKSYYKILLDEQLKIIKQMFYIFTSCQDLYHDLNGQTKLLEFIDKNNIISKEYQIIDFINNLIRFGKNHNLQTLLNIIIGIYHKYKDFYKKKGDLIHRFEMLNDTHLSEYPSPMNLPYMGSLKNLSKKVINKRNNEFRRKIIHNEIQNHIGQIFYIPTFGNAKLIEQVKTKDNLDYTNKFIIEYPSGSKYILNIGKLTTIINDKQLDNQLKIDYENTLDILKTSIQENMFNIYMPFLINIDYAGWGADIYVKKMCL